MKDLTLPTPALLPCPFCGNDKPYFERMGTGSVSCQVACGNCGAWHESSDEYLQSGKSWNARAALSSNQAATDKESLTVAPVALGGEPPCNPHPDAPHGYNRNASHNAGRYVCDCEGWAALGGEKGEAVAHGSGSPLDGLADKYGTRWGAPDEMGWSFEQHAFQDFCAEFADAIRTHKGTQ